MARDRVDWDLVDALMAVSTGGSPTELLAVLTPSLAAHGSALALRRDRGAKHWSASHGEPPPRAVAQRATERRGVVIDGECAAVALHDADEDLGALAVRWETPTLAGTHQRQLSAVADRLARALARAQAPALDRPPLSDAVGALITTDERGTILFATSGAASLLGYDVLAFVGMPAQALLPERLRAALAQALEDPPLDLEAMPVRLALLARHEDGTEIPVEVSITSTTRPARRYTVAIVDTAVMRGLELKLSEMHRLESIGRLAAGVAHDFTNLLTSINGCAHLMLSRMASVDPSHEDARTIVRCTEEAGELITRLQAFGQGERLEVQAIDLNQTLRDMARLLEVMLGEHVTLDLRLGQRIPLVEANLGALEQVVMQLAANARAAMPKGGSLVIETAGVDVTGQRRVLLTVTDTGVGMDASTLRRAFEPFYTTKRRGSGTGLGLSTVYGIVHRLGGTITLDSMVGEGTVARIDVPAAMTAPHVAGPGPSAAALTVMFVEDEHQVRSIVTRILADEGYRLLVAASGDEALELAERTLGKIDLLVSDVVMAGLTGPELAARLRARRPDMKVLMISGYAGMPLGTIDDFLPKPFNPFELVRRVRKLLRP